MAVNFREQEEQQWADITNEYYYEDDARDDLDPEDDISEEEEQAQHRERIRMAEGVRDFLAVIVGAALILLLVAVLISLFSWLRRDIGSTLAIWFKKM